MFKKNLSEKRKQKSIKILKEHGIPYIDHLPVIESDTTLYTKEAICDRAACLSLVAAYAEGVEKELLMQKAEEYTILDKFSSEEKEFFEMTEISDAVKAKFLWRYEALWVLLWSLGYVETLELPIGICDVPFAVKLIVTQNREQFVSNAKLRTQDEILDQVDLVFRLHWATTEARLKGLEMPASLNNDTVYERHYALNWLIKTDNADWDRVSTNT